MSEIVSREAVFRQAISTQWEEIHFAAYADWLEENHRATEATAIRWLWVNARFPSLRQRMVTHGSLTELRDCWVWEAERSNNQQPHHLPMATLNQLKGISSYPSDSTGTLVMYDIWQDAMMALGNVVIDCGEIELGGSLEL